MLVRHYVTYSIWALILCTRLMSKDCKERVGYRKYLTRSKSFTPKVRHPRLVSLIQVHSSNSRHRTSRHRRSFSKTFISRLEVIALISSLCGLQIKKTCKQHKKMHLLYSKMRNIILLLLICHCISSAVSIAIQRCSLSNSTLPFPSSRSARFPPLTFPLSAPTP